MNAARLVHQLLASSLLCGSVSVAAAVQIAPPEYAARRDALLAGIDSGVVLAFGGVEPVTDWPPFRQLPSFEYLTGFAEPNAALLLVKQGTGRTAALFVPPRDLLVERFVGKRTGSGEVAAKTGIAGRPLVELRPAVDSLVAAGVPLYLVPDVQSNDYAEVDSLRRGVRFLGDLRRDRPSLVAHSLDTALARLRARKSSAELALLRRAAEISVRAHREAMRAVGPGCGENEIQALLEGTFRRLGGDGPGYGSIVGSGPNATVLHYDANTRVMQDGDLVLIDPATQFAHYAADVTRTLPVSGRFSPEQRAVYQIVRDAQAAVVRQIKPGVAIAVALDSGRAVVAEGLARLGLIESPDAMFDAPFPCQSGGCPQRALFAYHGYGGHGIGLEVHDPAQFYAAPNTVQPGDAFTVEPGLYVNPEAFEGLPETPRNRDMIAKIRPMVEKYRYIGVRIEDDYIVSDAGVELISFGLPREIREVEAAMRERSPDLPGGGPCGRRRGRNRFARVP